LRRINIDGEWALLEPMEPQAARLFVCGGDQYSGCGGEFVHDGAYPPECPLCGAFYCGDSCCGYDCVEVEGPHPPPHKSSAQPLDTESQ